MTRRDDWLLTALLVIVSCVVIVALVLVIFAVRSEPKRSLHPDLPDRSLTPGAVAVGVTKKQVCTPGYTAKVRNVPLSVRKKVFAEYGIPYADASKYEVDHLISLELGGSNDIRNLWPEFGPRPNPKDKVENTLHRRVCSGAMTLEAAQRAIATNWKTAA